MQRDWTARGVKALKYAFDKSVPVVGGVISGTYEGLRAGAIVLKNAAGTVALLLLFLYFTAPGIRMLCSVISMRITGRHMRRGGRRENIRYAYGGG